jgi:oligoribonuclease NrnB/cAMP/cGMP phosphodiesterase (DHH superfamily)
MIDDILFAEPMDMQDGKVEIMSNDITTNLPYVDGVHLCFDHHISETKRVGDRDNHIIIGDAPSAARVVYEHFGGQKNFPGISLDLMEAVDKADSAQYSEEDILAPDPWTLVNFMLDPRTGLSRFGDFAISNEQLMKDIMDYCRHHPVDEILEIRDEEERLHLYLEHEELSEQQLSRYTKMEGKVAVLDLRNEDPVFSCNRFTVYTLFPECNVSIQVLPNHDGSKIVLAVGKSILNRTTDANIGMLMLEFGGGGHASAGTCQIDSDKADGVLQEIVQRLQENT